MPLDLPAVLGREASGVVEAVGPEVTGFAPGDEVFGATAEAGFSEYALLDADVTAHKPTELPFTAAAALPIAGVTAYNAVAQLQPGQRTSSSSPARPVVSAWPCSNCCATGVYV